MIDEMVDDYDDCVNVSVIVDVDLVRERIELNKKEEKFLIM